MGSYKMSKDFKSNLPEIYITLHGTCMVSNQITWFQPDKSTLHCAVCGAYSTYRGCASSVLATWLGLNIQ